MVCLSITIILKHLLHLHLNIISITIIILVLSTHQPNPKEDTFSQVVLQS